MAKNNRFPEIDPRVNLPDREIIYWLQASHPLDEILPPPGACWKLACSTVILDRAEIVTRWADKKHVFVTVKFDPLMVTKARLLQAA